MPLTVQRSYPTSIIKNDFNVSSYSFYREALSVPFSKAWSEIINENNLSCTQFVTRVLGARRVQVSSWMLRRAKKFIAKQKRYRDP